VIPYFQVPEVPIGPLTLSPFGVLAAAGILVGTQLITRLAKRDGLDPRPLADYALWGVLSGVVVGHLVHLFAYHPEELERGGVLQIFKVWDGLSSFGGLLGGVIAAMVYFRIKRLSFNAYGDALAIGVSVGWGIARLGCFAVHDHPGVPSTFFLAVDFPPPYGPRHDLGLYDAILLFALAGLLYALRRQNLLRYRLLPLLALLYGIGRFFEDFLRASDTGYVDARYFGLTPAQYFCFGLVAYGIYGLAKFRPPPAAGAKTKTARA
jgi:phosphatidylglycerol:prolipoprotein diacylglycerol transferase